MSTIRTRLRPRIIMAGTSITSAGALFDWWQFLRSDLAPEFEAEFGVPASPNWTTGTFAADGVTHDPRVGSGPSWIQSGVSGNQASDCVTGYATRVGAHGGDILNLEFGVNEVVLGTSVNTFITNYTILVTNFLAEGPRNRVVCCLPMVIGEKTPFPNASNFNDAGIDDVCDAITTIALTYGCTIVDHNTLARNLEATYNTSNLAGGVLFDTTAPGGRGIHPQTFMKRQMCDLWLSQVDLP